MKGGKNKHHVWSILLVTIIAFIVLVIVLSILKIASLQKPVQSEDSPVDDSLTSMTIEYEDGAYLDIRTDFTANIRQVGYFQSQEDKTPIALTEYNSNGELIREVQAATDTNPTAYEHNYTYDDAGNRLTDQCLEAGQPYSLLENTYDSENRLIRSTLTVQDSVTVKTYEYDGTTIYEATETDGNVTENRSVEYTYDNAGRILTSTETVNGVKTAYSTFEYDDEGRQINCTCVTYGADSSSGDRTTITETEYMTQDQFVQSVWENGRQISSYRGYGSWLSVQVNQ